MNKFCFIISSPNGRVIEYCRVNSDRFELLNQVLFQKVKKIEGNQKIEISEEKLYEKITFLLSHRILQEDEIDFGTRFDEESLYEIVIFDNKRFKLNKSGVDNLTIFAINLFNNIENELEVKFSKYKKSSQEL